MKFEVTNPKAWKAVNEKQIPMSHKIKVYEKLGGAYRLGEDGGEQVFNKMTELLKHRMQEGDDNSSSEETLAGLNDMAMGNLERIADYANMIETRMKEGQKLDSWMYSQLTIALENLNSVHDAMDGDDGEREPMLKESFTKGQTYGGTACKGGCFMGKQGLMKIMKISKDSPKDVFMFRDDNYSGLQPHFIKNGVIAKATVINPAYDFEKHVVRNLKIDNDVILSFRLFV